MIGITAEDRDGSDNVKDNATPHRPAWPLSFRLRPSKPQGCSLEAYGYGSAKRPPRRWWSYRLYRGPGNKEVEILYSNNKAQSEIIAQHFISESIVGFDMEWPWNDWKRTDLQNKIGLIQIASETKIGLFHIGMHPGTTTDDIIAPTLRKIIESPKIGKVGVAILNADFGRLRRYFGLAPKGAIESSHLYRLVKYGDWKPELVSVKLVSLAKQVEDQLGLPLFKGAVRTSNWSKALCDDQINYAASDAYAGLMLFHCMNAKRLSMKRVPPIPVFAERYPAGRSRSKDDPLLLEGGNGKTISSAAFYGTKPLISEVSKGDEKAKNIAAAAKKDQASVPALSPTSQALFDALIARRGQIAQSIHMQAYRIISDRLLATLAVQRPHNRHGLLSIRGIGEQQVQKYGSAWLEIISKFTIDRGLDEASPKKPAIIVDLTSSSPTRESEHTPRQARITAEPRHDDSRDRSTPIRRPPQLHTGISFDLARTSLPDDDSPSVDDSDNASADDEWFVPNGNNCSPSRRDSSGQKRRREASPSTNSRYTRAVDRATESAHYGLTNVQCSPSNPPLSPASRIARNRLSAFSRVVAGRLPNRLNSTPPLVAEHTLETIVRIAPTTKVDLEQIPGLGELISACETAGIECFENIIKFAKRGTYQVQ